ncbi:response regulator [Halobacteriovorax marinus]|nr:response regulator [Halobacteriovorax marinus]
MDLKFIVIDDSAEMVALLNKFIENCQLGHGHSFENEFEAMDFVSVNKADVLIIDVNLKHINGFKLGDMLREMLKIELPIIYISSNDLYLKEFYDSDQRNTYFMNKPFDKETFESVIKKMTNTN